MVLGFPVMVQFLQLTTAFSRRIARYQAFHNSTSCKNLLAIVTRSYLKNGKLALKPKLGANEWILQMNNGQL
jgi:hypothetical protein